MQSETNDLVSEVHSFETWIAWGLVGMQQWMQNVKAEKKPLLFWKMDDSNYHEQWLTIGLHFVSPYFFLFSFPFVKH